MHIAIELEQKRKLKEGHAYVVEIKRNTRWALRNLNTDEAGNSRNKATSMMKTSDNDGKGQYDVVIAVDDTKKQ